MRPVMARTGKADQKCSGKEVGNNPVGKLGDLVLEHQLALLEPSNLDLVGRTGLPKRLDLVVESTMLGLEHGEDLPRIVVVHDAGT